jgi:hypothetical protein
MNLIKEHFAVRFSERLLTKLLTVWLLLFPFDAFILPIHLGLFTLYPYLLLTGILLLYSTVWLLGNWPKGIYRYAIIVYSALAIYSIVFASQLPFSTAVLYDIRSMLLQTATIIILIGSYARLGVDTFRNTLVKSLTVILIFLFAIAWFEYFSGIHIAGAHTDKLIHYPVGNHTYAPVFVYDNPNTFLVYPLGVAMMLFLLKPQWLAQFNKAFPIIIHLLFFALVADSRLAKLISIGLLLWIGIRYILANKLIWKSFYFLSLTGMLIAGALVFGVNTKYWGPIWQNGSDYLLNSIEIPIEKNGKLYFTDCDSLVTRYSKDTLLKAYTRFERHGNMGSNVVRKNLVRNGLHLIKNYPLSGIGPGQYVRYSSAGWLLYPTGSVNSPHESITELVSQYGIPLGALVMIIFVWVGINHLKLKGPYIERVQYIFIALLCLGIGAMPSAWFILNVGWMMSGILILSAEFRRTP